MMDCPHCTDGRWSYGAGRSYRCTACHGTGNAECNCGQLATSLSLFDREPQCAACAVVDYSDNLEYLTGQGLTAQQAQRWTSMMPSLTDAEIQRFAGLSDEAYIAEVVAVCGKEAAACLAGDDESTDTEAA